MEFSNLYFLYIFLPLTLAVYFLIPGLKRKNVVLLVASLVFYAMGQPYYLPLLIAAIVLLLIGIVFSAVFYRCPTCGRALPVRGKTPRTCPFCGGAIE